MADATTTTKQHGHPLWELVRVRVLEFVREPGALFWVFGFPLILAVALGLAFRNRPPDPVRVVVTDAALHAQLAAQAARPSTVDARLASREEALLALRRGQVDVLVAKDGERLVYRFDDTRPESRVARLAIERALEDARGIPRALPSTDENVSEPGSRYIDFLLPGLIGMNLLGSSMWGIGYSVVDARKRKLLKRYAATPMKRRHYLLSLLLSRLLFLAVEVVALVLIGELAFGVHVQGSYGAVFALCLIGGAAFTGLSLLIAARPSSTEVASGWLNFAMLPMWLVSGSFFSSARFPEWLQPPIQALPLTALNDALRAVINEGAALSSQTSEIALLLLWAAVPFALALRLFRWQ